MAPKGGINEAKRKIKTDVLTYILCVKKKGFTVTYTRNSSQGGAQSPNWEPGTQPRSITLVAAIQVLESSPLPPSVYSRRKLELGAEMEMESKPFNPELHLNC